MAGITVDFSGLLQLVFAIRVTSTGAQIVSGWVLLLQVVFYVFLFFTRVFISLPSLPPPLPLPFSFIFLIAVFSLLFLPVGRPFGVEINGVR